jgi:hypothetical protein
VADGASEFSLGAAANASAPLHKNRSDARRPFMGGDEQSLTDTTIWPIERKRVCSASSVAVRGTTEPISGPSHRLAP